MRRQQVLFISSPFGPFFKTVAQLFASSGHNVWRIAWEGGDFLETPTQHRITFRGTRDDEETFLRNVIIEKRITTIICFNDTGRRDCLAIRLAKELGVSKFILENGYMRPHWITFDREGVNGYSSLPRDPGFYLSHPSNGTAATVFPVSMRDHVRHNIKHFAANIVCSPILRHDASYYGDSLSMQAWHYAVEYAWRVTHEEKYKVARIAELRRAKASRKVFVALLQKPGDSQLRVHSSYVRNRPFLKEVCVSFAADAPKDAILVVKQHPYDYGVERLPRYFKKLVSDLGIEARAFYLRKTSIDVTLDNAHGLITVNSTGGLSAVMRGVPVLCLGDAVFDMEGLTFQGGLKRFWHDARPPAADLVSAFVRYLTSHSQLNGGFYSREGIELAARAILRIVSEDALAPHQLSIRSKEPRDWFAPLPLPIPQLASHGGL